MIASDEELTTLVRRTLPTLFPMPEAGELTDPAKRRPRPLSGLVAAGAAAAVVAVIAITVAVATSSSGEHHSAPPAASNSAASNSAPSTSASPSPSTSAPALPAWVDQCLPHATNTSQFVGMTYPAARTLAQSKDITLVILGRAGTCFPIPAVAWHNPLLILLDGQDRVLATRPLLDPDLPQGTNS